MLHTGRKYAVFVDSERRINHVGSDVVCDHQVADDAAVAGRNDGQRQKVRPTFVTMQFVRKLYTTASHKSWQIFALSVTQRWTVHLVHRWTSSRGCTALHPLPTTDSPATPSVLQQAHRAQMQRHFFMTRNMSIYSLYCMCASFLLFLLISAFVRNKLVCVCVFIRVTCGYVLRFFFIFLTFLL